MLEQTASSQERTGSDEQVIEDLIDGSRLILDM